MTTPAEEELRELFTAVGFVIVDNRAVHKATDLIITEREAERLSAHFQKFIASQQQGLLDLLYWQYKELNDQSVDMKFVEAYNILSESIKGELGEKS